MKRKMFCLTAFVLLIFTVFPQAYVANADTNYFRVINSETPFYRDKEMQSLAFYLPYTYYVKVLSVDGDVAHVECYGQAGSIAMDGYTPYSLLYKDNLLTDAPYLSLTITTVEPTKLYEDANLKTPTRYLFQERTLSYYGSIETQLGIVYYVSYNGQFGYVSEEAVYPFTVANHPNELTFLIQNEPSSSSESKDTLKDTGDSSDNYLTIRIVIISCLVLAGLIALFTVKRPKKAAQTTDYYDENEYE